MQRTTIEVSSFGVPNAIGMALALLVNQAIGNMAWTDYYKAEYVTPDTRELSQGMRPYTELSYDDDACNEGQKIELPIGAKSNGMTYVRIYERSIAGWCDIEFLDNDLHIVYEKKTILPFYTGSLVALMTEYLLTGKIFLNLEPIPFSNDRPEGNGAGWFLQEGRPPYVYDTPQEAFEKDDRTPKFFKRLVKAANDMGLPEIAEYFDRIDNQLEAMGYRDGRPTPHPGELTVHIENGKRNGSRKWTDDEIKGAAIQNAMDAGLIQQDLLTPQQMRFYTTYLMQRALHFDAVRRERAALGH
jgi:hypothetical protein